ncbi:MAG: YeeE/YedE family protein [Sedimentisphaerales bacterium]|nr:YeeE/YedE family protein [Sedimentisphaerales bacterium]
MLSTLHVNKKIQLVLGLIMGIVFGFLLEKGGVTKYDILIGQLLLRDFTVLKIMLSAVLVGMLGVHFLCSLGMAKLHPKSGSIGSSVIGGLIFGTGFGILGYCPGTVVAAAGTGAIDALLGGVVGILIGAWLFVLAYPKLQESILNKMNFGELTLPELFKVNRWIVVIPVSIMLIVFLLLIYKAGW